MSRRSLYCTVLAFGLLAAVAYAGQPTPVALVLMEGDVLGGSTVSSLNTPFTDGNGKVGFVGALADNQRFIWWNSGPVFYSNQALPDVLTGGESTMGVSNTGGFIYSPSFNGEDAVYTHNGKLLAGTDPAPNLPGFYSSFNSRPTMVANGTAYWVGGIATSPTGSTAARVMWECADTSNPGSAVPLLKSGDVVGGQTIDTSGIDFDYWFSDENRHYIQVLDMTGATATDFFVYVDGALTAREGSPTGAGDNWQAFDSVSINNAGNYVFSGDTDGATSADEYIAYNGAIGVREGDTIGGVTLSSGWSVTALSLNNTGQAAHIWGTTGSEHLFLGDASDLRNTSVELLAVGDEVDVTGDGLADFVVSDFNASGTIGPGLDLAEDGWVYVNVDLTRIGGTETFVAIIGVPEPASLGLLALGLLVLRRR